MNQRSLLEKIRECWGNDGALAMLIGWEAENRYHAPVQDIDKQEMRRIKLAAEGGLLVGQSATPEEACESLQRFLDTI